jgi:hypothetical protein
VDKRLPALADVRERAGIPKGVTPRKSQPAYARVIVQLLRAARALSAPTTSLERLIYVGDTRMNDGNAFANIALAGGWPGVAFIASETEDPAPPEILEKENSALYLASRWSDIAGGASHPSFEQFCQEEGFPTDEQTAIIIDLDKTALGARGRNDHVINQVRVEAVRRTVGQLLRDDFDAQAFESAYEVLNRSEFHPFTADNQDYLAYVCLILGSGLYQPASVVRRVRAGELRTFEQFIAEVSQRSDKLAASLRPIHERICDRVQAGDPTPFKAFRYQEYRATVERMGYLPDDASARDLLASEIVITQEVREAALRWKREGALLFGLSDKPDEASIPTKEWAHEGLLPIHRVETHAVGAR